MSDSPASTLTFLFTDIEGSTQLWEQHAETMRTALVRHDSILHESVQRRDGTVVKSTGDGIHAVFGHAADAVRAVADAQRALAAEPWGEVGQVRVRMGVHSGPAEQRAGDYYGSTLNRAARLMAIAHGEQVLLSESAAGLARDSLPQEAALRDMGEHRLKDLTRPERVYQLVAPGLRADFPPLCSLTSFPNNLPVQLTNFVGRERVLSDTRRMLASTHLLTLTGPGGTGKTRLALHLAADMLDEYADGAWLVELAPLTDPALVLQSIAGALNVREQPSRSLIAVVSDFLRDKRLLLILDNCEHVIESCAEQSESLLRAAPQLRIVASSREPLGIAGEAIFRVPPLSLPQVPGAPGAISAPGSDEAGRTRETGRSMPDISQSEAVRLFVERAQAARASFALTAADGPAVAQICTRLDGIPLAIELAAARVRSLSVSEIASRLDDQFRLLTGGSRTALPRQQTLRALIDWSYNLLTPSECILFRRLAVFAGGWTLDAAENVTANGAEATGSAALASEEVYDTLDSLVNKSLVISEPRGDCTHYRFLETIRQYARDRLVEAGESERIRDRHLDYVVQFAREVEPSLTLAENAEWADRAGLELDNIRAALDWSLERKPLSALHILYSLMFFWQNSEYLPEGKRWYEQALLRTDGELGDEFKRARARVFTALAAASVAHGDIQTAVRARDESLRLYADLGQPPETARGLAFAVLTATYAGDAEAAEAYFTEGRAIAQAAGDKFDEMMMYGMMGRVAGMRGEHAAYEAYMDRAATLAREIGSNYGLATALMGGGMAAISQGDYAVARARLEQSHAMFARGGSRHFMNVTRSELANVARLLGEYEHASRLYGEVIVFWKHQGHRAGIARCFECLAFIAGARGDTSRAAQLFGAAQALREAAHSNMTPDEQAEYASELARIRAAADPTAFDAAWAAGRALTLEGAIQMALSGG